MYVVEIFENLTDREIDQALTRLRAQFRKTRTMVMAVNRDNGDAVHLSAQPERDLKQAHVICKALNDAG